MEIGNCIINITNKKIKPEKTKEKIISEASVENVQESAESEIDCL